MDVVAELADIVGARGVSTDPADLRAYGLDWTRFYEPAPRAIVWVGNVEQLQSVVRFARARSIGLVPSGGRTGLSGGACATDGEIVVSFDRMNRLLEFNAVDRTLTVEAGMMDSEQVVKGCQCKG